MKSLSIGSPAPTAADSQYLTDFSEKDKPWDTHRAAADRVRDLYRLAGCQRYADRIDGCSRSLEFALSLVDDGERVFTLLETRFCRVRHCPVCQWRRTLMWRARFLKAIPQLLEDYPKARFLFLTLTVKNCPVEDLRETLTNMNRAWQRLSQRKEFPAIGWVKSVEVTRGADGQAHPHFHCVLMVKSSYFKKAYLSQKRWRELWAESLRIDYDPWIWVKPIKFSSDNPEEAKEQLTKALCETLKYSVKESDLVFDAEWLKSITNQLHKMRSVAVGGLFKEYLSEDEPQDLIDSGLDEDTDVAESDPKLWFGWREMVRRYQVQS